VILQESPPGLRWRLPVTDQVLAHAGLADVHTEFEQFAVNPWGSPGWVRSAHQTDQIAYVFRNRRTPGLAMSDLPGPKKTKALSVPSDHGFGLAVQRGQQPRSPDSYLLRDVATILIDCALRPEECFRLKSENFRDGLIDIHKGKGKGSRRRIPASQRVQGILEMQKGQSASDWIFPAPTRSGHIEASS